MKVIVVGANGQVGTDVVSAFITAGHEVLALTHADIEISDRDNVNRVLDQPFEVLVNSTCLHTRPCEYDPAKAYLVNAIGARNLANAAREHNAKIIQISTDQVFSGKNEYPYTEFVTPCPVTVYGSTKLAGEYFVINSGADHQILRTTALFGRGATRGKAGGLNFVETMLKLSREKEVVTVVADEYSSPTSVESLAKQIVVLSTSKTQGVFHAVGKGGCSWFDFAKEIFKQTGTKVRLEPSTSTGEFHRPKYLILENARLRFLEMDVFQSWQDELRGYLGKRSDSFSSPKS
jgi:dTDP-4-dehydrorhamnose reductase